MRCPDCGEVLDEEAQEGEPRCDCCRADLYAGLLKEAREDIIHSYHAPELIERIDKAVRWEE